MKILNEGLKQRAAPYVQASVRVSLIASFGTMVFYSIFHPWLLVVFIVLWLVMSLAVSAAMVRQARSFKKEVEWNNVWVKSREPR